MNKDYLGPIDINKPKHLPPPLPTLKNFPPIGTRVRVVDGSEAHNDKGVVIHLGRDICLVELDCGCCWPISEIWEIENE